MQSIENDLENTCLFVRELYSLRLEKDVLSRTALFEALDDWVLDGALVEPPPYLVSEYLIHLASESHFSQLQAAVVRFPIHCIDLHQVSLQKGLSWWTITSRWQKKYFDLIDSSS